MTNIKSAEQVDSISSSISDCPISVAAFTVAFSNVRSNVIPFGIMLRSRDAFARHYHCRPHLALGGFGLTRFGANGETVTSF
ncbi:hypothetical protein [Altererythrobacter sp. MF3-039]|uniref:hypothetical protein n=1 Tax=Altererythrobacter sp. MF3-039 TaxID=3252901 RepID=UPI00390CA655